MIFRIAKFDNRGKLGELGNDWSALMARDRGFCPVMGMEIEFQLLFFALFFLIFDNWREEEIDGVGVIITWLLQLLQVLVKIVDI